VGMSGRERSGAKSGGGGKSSEGLAAILNDPSALRELALEAANATAAPGQISQDEANRYMSRIVNLFPGANRAVVELRLFTWGALNGTGADTDYAGMPDIEVDGMRVQATSIFGDIIPVSSAGIPRKFFSTYFEKMAPLLVAASPELVDKLAARCARACVRRGDVLSVLDFVKGVTSATAGSGSERQRAKDLLILRRSKGRTDDFARVAPMTEAAVLGSGTTETGGRGGLY